MKVNFSFNRTWLAAIFGASLVAVFAALPAALMATIAGLALLAPFVGSLAVALEKPAHRYAAGVTFAVSAAGVRGGEVRAAPAGVLADTCARASDVPASSRKLTVPMRRLRG